MTGRIHRDQSRCDEPISSAEDCRITHQPAHPDGFHFRAFTMEPITHVHVNRQAPRRHVCSPFQSMQTGSVTGHSELHTTKLRMQAGHRANEIVPSHPLPQGVADADCGQDTDQQKFAVNMGSLHIPGAARITPTAARVSMMASRTPEWRTNTGLQQNKGSLLQLLHPATASSSQVQTLHNKQQDPMWQQLATLDVQKSQPHASTERCRCSDGIRYHNHSSVRSAAFLPISGQCSPECASPVMQETHSMSVSLELLEAALAASKLC